MLWQTIRCLFDDRRGPRYRNWSNGRRVATLTCTLTCKNVWIRCRRLFFDAQGGPRYRNWPKGRRVKPEEEPRERGPGTSKRPLGGGRLQKGIFYKEFNLKTNRFWQAARFGKLAVQEGSGQEQSEAILLQKMHGLAAGGQFLTHRADRGIKTGQMAAEWRPWHRLWLHMYTYFEALLLFWSKNTNNEKNTIVRPLKETIPLTK